MKGILVSVFLVSVLVSVASAQPFIGAKIGGMGGAGVANATDLSAVYYNPAGLMKAGNFEFKLSLNPSYTNYQEVLDAFNSSTDPSTFLQDNFDNNLSFQGDLAGMVGLNIRKIGISAIILPLGNYAGDTLAAPNTINIIKPAGQLQGSANYAVRQDTILTLGHTFTIPGLPIASLDTGVNLKAINATYGSISAAFPATSGTYYKGTGSGTAFDLGARTSLDAPLVGSLAVGLAIKDLAGQINYKRKSETYYFDNATETITKSAESDLADKSVTLDPTTVIGAAATVPAINLAVAADLEMKKSETVTHLGVEYPLMPGVLIGRAGLASSPSISKTTLGVKLNLPFLTLDVATIMDGKNSSLMGWVIDIGAGF
jgi:hypothetical protein